MAALRLRSHLAGGLRRTGRWLLDTAERLERPAGPAGTGPARVRREAAEPAVVEPAVVEPAVVEPAVVEPAVVDPAVAGFGTGSGPGSDAPEEPAEPVGRFELGARGAGRPPAGWLQELGGRDPRQLHGGRGSRGRPRGPGDLRVVPSRSRPGPEPAIPSVRPGLPAGVERGADPAVVDRAGSAPVPPARSVAVAPDQHAAAGSVGDRPGSSGAPVPVRPAALNHPAAPVRPAAIAAAPGNPAGHPPLTGPARPEFWPALLDDSPLWHTPVPGPARAADHRLDDEQRGRSWNG